MPGNISKDLLLVNPCAYAGALRSTISRFPYSQEREELQKWRLKREITNKPRLVDAYNGEDQVCTYLDLTKLLM